MNKEPWVSILGALEDVKAGKATPEEALEWIKWYMVNVEDMIDNNVADAKN